MKMGVLVFMRNLLLALSLFLVLGFLYYSAWKLHLLRWEDSRKPFATKEYIEGFLPENYGHINKPGTPRKLEAKSDSEGLNMSSCVTDSLPQAFDSVGHSLGPAGEATLCIYGHKKHKEGTPLGLIVGSINSLTYNMAKYIANILHKLSEYDRLGFLLKLDTKLQAEISTRYANFTEGVCKPGYASTMMFAIFPKFSRPAPMFLDDSFRKWGRIREFVPPFGIKGQDNLIKAILTATKEYRLTPTLDSLSCRRCIIVGNGGVLANKCLGSKIDEYDVVVRLNSAPIKGFEKDVGSKTTLRITYPEGAIQKLEQYEKDSLFVLAGFKWQDFKWLKYIVYKEKVLNPVQPKNSSCDYFQKDEPTTRSSSASDGFWKSVATRVPREPRDIRILNPYFIQEAAFSFIGLPFNNGLMGRGNIPTLGSVAITMALHNCDEVAVAGFGYDMTLPNAPLHYYETIKMAAINESWTHNIQKEKEFLRKLVKARVINDLTSGI